MKERWVTLVCALGALVLFAALFLRGEATGERRGSVPSPTSEERRGNGYHGALMWLDEQGIRTVSVRDRLDRWLAEPGAPGRGLPASGNLLIVTLPVVTPFKTEELRPLAAWVRAGNTLLVLAALDDEPDWAFAMGRPVANELSLLAGLEVEARGEGSGGGRGAGGTGGAAGSARQGDSSADVGERIAATARALAQPQVDTLVPNGVHAYFAGVRTAVALSDYPAQSWAIKVPYDGFALSLAHERDTGVSVLWTRSVGQGRLILSGFGSLFTNRVLGRADNAQLLANLVGTTVSPKGAVLFDDLHQGLSSSYDPARLYSDPRLYASVGILAVLWLCWVLGATPLRLPRPRVAAPREVELVQATGSFLARVLTTDQGALGLFDHFFRRLGSRGGEPVWALLEDHPGIGTPELRQLRGWYEDAKAARRVPLIRLRNLMVKIDRQMAV